jgi:MYXO-CTERM domain-containing protein
MTVAFERPAAADVGIGEFTEILSPSETDLAPVTGNPPRLKRTDQEQPGAEMAHLAFFKGNKSGLYFEMRSGEINGALPNDREQLALVPFSLSQDAATGTVKAVGNMTGARFVTDNRGNERRNANHPIAFPINDGANICAEYNYQPNNGNDTKRYIQCYDQTGATVLPQTQIYAKNNDDCSMAQDAQSTTVISQAAGKTRLIAWRGCNGDGQDDGWMQAFQLNTDASGAVTFKPEFDVSLAQREERSRGFCSVAAADPDTAICSWTEGNNQPQRDGTWLAAVNVAAGTTGTDKQANILWKKQIDGRKGDGDTRTYSMRAMHSRILTQDANGLLVPSDMIMWRSGDVRGNNNSNEGKGGTYYGNQMAVMKVGKDGMSYVIPMTNVADKLLGLDGTHLGMQTALFGTTDALKPGLIFVGGSQTGGGYSAKLRAVGFDTTAGAVSDLGSYSIAPYDRHLYPNYLGNNPGNQGRNFSGTELVPNPYVGQNGNKDAFLMVTTTTGKSPANMARPELKLSSFISVLPISQTPAVTAPTDPGATPPTTGTPGSGSDPTGSDTSGGAAGSSTDLGGCSAGGAGASGFGALFLGLAALLRRRKK